MGKYDYYWNKVKKQKENKPLNWDKIIWVSCFYPSVAFLFVIYSLTVWFRVTGK